MTKRRCNFQFYDENSSFSKLIENCTYLSLLTTRTNKKEVEMTSLYEEKILSIKDKILSNMYEIRTTLAEMLNSDRCVQLNADDHVINLDENEVKKLLNHQKEALEGVKELEWYMKIYLDKTQIEEDIKICAGVTGFLEKLNLEENIKLGRMNKDGTIEK